MEPQEQLTPVETTHIFNMTIMVAGQLMPCDVYHAALADGTTFTRVVTYPDNESLQRIIDVDRWEEGWIDMYTGEASAWSDMVANSLDFHIAQANQKK